MKHLMFLICFLAISGMAFGQNKAADAAMAKVAALPEVRSFMRTTKTSQPKIMMDTTLDEASKCYWVQVGISNMDMFRTNFDFLVDPKTQHVFYIDKFADAGTKTLTLSQWRKWRKLPDWQKLHCYTGSGKNLKFKACVI